jgi:hypothetical protein
VQIHRNGPAEVLQEGSPLGNYGNNCPTAAQAAFRRDSLRLREVLWKWSSVPDVRKCGRVPCVQRMPVVEVGGAYRLGGLCRCHSIWLCPVCAPERRSARAVQIGSAAARHLENGGGVEFGSATVQHGPGSSLRATYGGVAKAWHSMNRNRAVVDFRQRHGFWGFVRTAEVTWGVVNGWHPHTHWVDFWDSPLSDAERSEYVELLYSAWETRVVGLGMGRPLQPHAIRVLPVRHGADNAKAVGEYLFEMSPMAAAHELTSLSTKQAKKHGFTPFQILWSVHDSGGQPQWTHLWWEYEKATRGRRMLGTTKGILRRLELPEDDPEVFDVGAVVGYVSSEEWGRLRFYGAGVEGVQGVVEAAAAGGQIGIDAAMGLLLGAIPPRQSQYDDVAPLGPGDDGGMF